MAIADFPVKQTTKESTLSIQRRELGIVLKLGDKEFDPTGCKAIVAVKLVVDAVLRIGGIWIWTSASRPHVVFLPAPSVSVRRKLRDLFPATLHFRIAEALLDFLDHLTRFH